MRKTRYVRLKLDFTLRLAEEVDSVPFGCPDINSMIVGGLLTFIDKDEADKLYILKGARLSMDLAYPKTSTPAASKPRTKPASKARRARG